MRPMLKPTTTPLPQPLTAVAGIRPYVPGRPMEDVMREFGLSHVIKLASNENPFGPSPLAMEAYQKAAKDLWLYPDNDALRLSEKIAALHGVTRQQVVLGTGSSHILELAVRAYAGQGADVVFPAHGFICYSLFTQACGANAIKVPERQYRADPVALAQAITPRTKVLFIANPNNPTGTMLDEAELLRLLKAVPSHVLVVLDEAYADYAQAEGGPDGTKLVDEFPNLLVTRTFSKAYGLAALRVGYGIGHPEIVSMLARLRPPFSVCSPGLAAAEAALADMDHIQRAVTHNTMEKTRLTRAYADLGFLACPSHGNFLLLDVAKTKKDPADIFALFQAQGVIVRPVKEYGLATHLRVSIGTTAENDAALHLFQTLGA